MNFKRLFVKSVSGLMIVGFLSPLAVLAAREDAMQKVKEARDKVKAAASQTPNTEKNFCNSFLNVSSKLDQKLAESQSRIQQKRVEIQNRLQERKADREEKLAQKRARWDANREEHFDSLEQKATTDAQKQALVKFKSAVSAAIAARRSAVDLANKTFQDGIKKATADRKAASDAAAAVYKNSVKAAYDKAKADCQSGVDAKTVRTTLRAAIKAARDKYTADKKNIDKLSNSLKPLIDAHRAAIKKANSDFKAAMEKARKELKAAFKQSPSPSPSPSPSSSPSPSASATPSPSASATPSASETPSPSVSATPSPSPTE